MQTESSKRFYIVKSNKNDQKDHRRINWMEDWITEDLIIKDSGLKLYRLIFLNALMKASIDRRVCLFLGLTL